MTVDTYIGIDLGGARGKTTAVAVLVPDGPDGVAVQDVRARYRPHLPWYDDVLTDFVCGLGTGVIVAINAPLTVPACVRCRLDRCPGVDACVDPSVIWLRTEGAEMVAAAEARDLDRIAAVPSSAQPHTLTAGSTSGPPQGTRPRIAPYVHRCTEVELCFQRNQLPRDQMGAGTGPIAARAAHLTRVLTAHGLTLHDDLVEVSPRATVHALFGADAARGYKRDADPWRTRAAIVDGLDGLRFAPTSRLSKEEVLRNDHCFESLLSAYTAFLRDRDGWTMPDEDAFEEDGFIWAPPA